MSVMPNRLKLVKSNSDTAKVEILGTPVWYTAVSSKKTDCMAYGFFHAEIRVNEPVLLSLETPHEVSSMRSDKHKFQILLHEEFRKALGIGKKAVPTNSGNMFRYVTNGPEYLESLRQNIPKKYQSLITSNTEYNTDTHMVFLSPSRAYLPVTFFAELRENTSLTSVPQFLGLPVTPKVFVGVDYRKLLEPNIRKLEGCSFRRSVAFRELDLPSCFIEVQLAYNPSRFIGQIETFQLNLSTKPDLRIFATPSNRLPYNSYAGKKAETILNLR